MSGFLASGVRTTGMEAPLSSTVEIMPLAGWAFGRNGESMIFDDRLAIAQLLTRKGDDADTAKRAEDEENDSAKKLVSFAMEKGTEKQTSMVMGQRGSWLTDFLQPPFFFGTNQ